MLGAVIGDIAGSCFEFHPIKRKTGWELFGPDSRYTDDTVMTCAVAKSLLEYSGDPGSLEELCVSNMRLLGNSHPHAGYGGSFSKWLASEDPRPYGSWGNGSAMRVSPAAYFATTLQEAMLIGKITASVTHDHPEGIKGAMAVSGCVYMALHGSSKEDIRSFVEEDFYDLGFTLDQIRPAYAFDVSCQGSVPQAIEAFLEAEDFEDAVRNAVSLGGDSDTMACIAGGIAGAYFGVPGDMVRTMTGYLDRELNGIVREFASACGIRMY